MNKREAYFVIILAAFIVVVPLLLYAFLNVEPPMPADASPAEAMVQARGMSASILPLFTKA